MPRYAVKVTQTRTYDFEVEAETPEAAEAEAERKYQEWDGAFDEESDLDHTTEVREATP